MPLPLWANGNGKGGGCVRRSRLKVPLRANVLPPEGVRQRVYSCCPAVGAAPCQVGPHVFKVSTRFILAESD